MTKYGLIILILFPFFAVGQRQLKSSVHLKPFEELDNATVTALAEDELGQIWIGTQTGIRFWDGLDLHQIATEGTTVTHLYSSGSYVYGVQLNAVLKVNCRTLDVKRFDFSYSDYRNCNFLEKEILVISGNAKDTVVLDYNLSQKPVPTDAHLSLKESAHLGNYQISLDHYPNKALIIGKDTAALSEAYVTHVVQYDEKTVFVASHEGLIELGLTGDGQLSRLLHFPTYRSEQLLVDRNRNLWVGTADNGLFLFHRNMIRNRYYPQLLNEKETNPCWTFERIDGLLYCCTSNGLVAFESQTDELTALEKATKGLFCFSAAETPNGTFVGTAKNGLFRFANNRLKQVYFNPENRMDNVIIQLLVEDHSIVVCTKAGIHRIDFEGKLLFSQPYGTEEHNSYVMKLYQYDGGFLAANTNGIYQYNQQFKPVKKVQSATASVFSDLAFFEGAWWCAAMDGGVFKFIGDSLVPVPAPERQLLMTTPFKNSLWFTGLSGAMSYTDGQFKSLRLENGFPLSEYAQGGLFNDGDSVLYFAGVQGIFAYISPVTQDTLQLPHWHVQYKGQYLPTGTKQTLKYDEAIVSLLPKAIITIDRNNFELDYNNGKQWLPVENGKPLLVELDYGTTELQFRLRHIHSGQVRMESFVFFRITPIWLRTWFRLVLLGAVLAALFGFYFLWKYFRTKKMLKQEAGERKIMQERLRISRELHDNIGARLSHIISSLDIQLFKEEGSDELATINAFAKETMSQLRETIWAVGDKTIFFSELKQRIEHYVIQTNSISLPTIRFVDESTVDFELNATETINLFRMTQEAINNALKYSNATEIRVGFKSVEAAVHITIADNGNGFLVDEALRRGSGLKGMKSRAEEIKVTLSIDSGPGKGTAVKLVIPAR